MNEIKEKEKTRTEKPLFLNRKNQEIFIKKFFSLLFYKICLALLTTKVENDKIFNNVKMF